MTKELNFIFLCFLLCCLSASAQSYQWGGSYGGDGEDVAFSLHVDPAGNSYTTGFFTENCDFDMSPNNYILSTSIFYQAFVMKTDNAGNFVWAKQFGSDEAFDYGTAVTTDAAGNVYVTGTFQETGDFDPGTGEFMLTTNGGIDIFVVKLDPNGNFVWAKNIGGLEYEESNGIGVDTQGNVYISGYFYNEVDFDPGAGVYNLTPAGNEGNGDGFVVKLSSNGDFVWAKQFGGDKFDLATAMKVRPNGDTYITGYFKETADFNPNPTETFLLTTPPQTVAGFLLHLNSDGAFIKAVKTGTSLNEIQNLAIDVDANDAAYITGYFGESASFDTPTPTAFTATSALSGYLAKINSDGTIAWAKQLPSEQFTGGFDIAVNSLNEVLVTGYYDGILQLGTTTLTKETDKAMESFFAKLNANGDFISAFRFGGVDAIDRAGIAVDATDNIYLTGVYQGSANINPVPGQANLVTAVDFRDDYLIKMSNTTLSVPDVQPNVTLKLYPNPSNSYINLKSSVPLVDKNYMVFDLTGRQILSGKIETNQRIDVRSLTKGTYIVNIDQSSYKIIKE
ncbi:T9SS type A sorting domain-containing protein [Flavobacterium sp. '19STA2R22 D10 B1']|uniref:T9SS type A sorting domain-containing protein n=1 Tax=Flavobacterium aerium TaxID=3037261 RepID=UPI00278C7B81|nr:T9SS type A sorting domain-containing protein [Flavobacterium sp. '19STA2R22 D10 B1']